MDLKWSRVCRLSAIPADDLPVAEFAFPGPVVGVGMSVPTVSCAMPSGSTSTGSGDVPLASPVRIARPSHDLRAAERFWVEGRGLVGDPEDATPAAPTEEDLLVLSSLSWP